MEKEEHDSPKKRYWIDVLLLVLIIILLVIIIWLLLRLHGYVNNRPVISAGDIFEINCQCDQSASDDTSTDGNAVNENASQDISTSGDTQSQSEGNLIVKDDTQVWEQTTHLPIFQNPMYQMKEIIAPGSSNSYQFYVRNNTTCFISYELTFIETNPYAINMQYRLKRNDQYLTSTWTSISTLSHYLKQLAPGDQDHYVLEWKWFEDDNDTDIGTKIAAFYQLSIRMNGNQVG